MESNSEIRYLIKKNRLKHYEVAHEVGISESRFCVWLRYPLSDEKKEKVIVAINNLSNAEVS